MDKRGQQLSVTSIILIVLGVLILVFLIVGFSLGWSKVMPWIKPTNNVKEVSDACKMACSTESVYGFCTMKKKVYVEEENAIDGQTEFEDTCNNLANAPKYAALGIEECIAITCPGVEEETPEEGEAATP